MYVLPEIEDEAELALWLRGQEFREARESAEARRREHDIHNHEAQERRRSTRNLE